jgi:hypothetical protein
MKTEQGTIVDFSGSWGSGVATLRVKVGRKTRSIYCENGPTVRALASMFEGVIAPGHSVNVDALRGQEIRFAVDEIGMLAGLAFPE